MKPRYEYLLYQAGLTADGVELGSYELEAIERLIELTIEDCYQKLIDMDQHAKASHNYYKHAAIQIRLHFGVKE